MDNLKKLLGGLSPHSCFQAMHCYILMKAYWNVSVVVVRLVHGDPKERQLGWVDKLGFCY